MTCCSYCGIHPDHAGNKASCGPHYGKPGCLLIASPTDASRPIISLPDADEMDDLFIEAVLDAPPTVLDQAAQLVDGDRQDAYGHPSVNHACTAALWEAYLTRRGDSERPWQGIDAYDVCLLNILQKVSRLAHSRTRDGLVDIAGFARNAEMVGE